MILAIETATPHGSVALVTGDALLAEAALPAGRQASETILGAVEGLFRATGSRRDDATHVAVSAGPGSFTGLRVGMAAAKGFCFGWGVPIVPVPTLHALALRFPSERLTLCPVLDARKKQVYAALFRWEGGACRRLSPDMAIAPAELAGKLPDGTVFFCGDAAAPFAPVFRERLGPKAVFPAPGEGLPRAGAVGLLAARLVREGAACDASGTVPVYVRPSEAERKRG
ncbi:MAG: tRNA (adenosine(37)-N6)-threonylcarbamoyltransferase complex dimerization subunit type 1 TsaB [Deltaproteobacteria bacterium]|nr:tRNA (adenosine(37)-N6)-threonylcarbamoyltransferase complex dimerization subunit type 1 TsaB [Deltaproteobacteria bacterium]